MRWLKKVLGQTGRKAAEERCTKGYIAAREGRLDDAQRLYDDAVDADPTLAVAAFNAGQTALERYNRDVANLDAAGRAQRLRTALKHLDAAVAIDDDHAPSWRAIARVQERLGDVVDAYDSWGRVERRLTPAPVVDELGQTLVREPTREQQEERSEARSERARLKPAADLARAMTTVQDLVGEAIVDPVASMLAVDALLTARDVAAAANVPSPAFLSTVAGTLARKVGQHERARTLFEAALVADPRDLEALRNLATVCLALGDLPAALKASTSAYRLDPIDAGLVCNVGVCHLALATSGAVGTHLASAREYIDLAKQLSPKDPIVLRAIAAVVDAERAAAAT